MKSESSEDARNSESDRPIRLRRNKKRKRQNFISPSSILTVFPDLEPGVLCQLAELDNPTPSAVLNLVPEASSAELGQFFDLLNGTPPPRPTPAVFSQAAKAIHCSRSSRKKWRPRTTSGIVLRFRNGLMSNRNVVTHLAVPRRSQIAYI